MATQTLPGRPLGGPPAKAGKAIARPAERDDRDFVDGAAGAELHGPRGFTSLLLLTIILFFVVFFVWASWGTLDEISRGDGRVIPSRRVQVVQNLEGGVVSAILAREGEVVEAGQTLLRIDDVGGATQYREAQARYVALRGSVARLDAEIDGRPEVTFPDDVARESPTVVANETALFASRRDELRSSLDIFARQREQRAQELTELLAQGRQAAGSLELAAQELRITEPLAERQIVSKVELLRLQREVNDLRGQGEQATLGVPRAEAALGEANRRVDEKLLAFRSEAIRERNSLLPEIAGLVEQMRAYADRVTRTDVKSPVRGTIKQVKVHTIGGVVQPGMDIVEVVPLEDSLLIEAQVRPGDIAFIHPGLPAMVKITAYDFSIYGGLKGKVEAISADTILDERNPQGESFYKVTVRTDDVLKDSGGNPLAIIPGMTAQVDVQTGEKTVMDYLLKPIFRARDEALRER